MKNLVALQRARDRRRCEWCYRAIEGKADPAHIFSRGAGRADLDENLLSLCRWCHTASHNGSISRLLLLIVAGHREKLLVADIEENVWAARRSDAKATTSNRPGRAVPADHHPEQQGQGLGEDVQPPLAAADAEGGQPDLETSQFGRF